MTDQSFSTRQVALVIGLLVLALTTLSFIKAGGDFSTIKANIFNWTEEKPVFLTEENINQYKLR